MPSLLLSAKDRSLRLMPYAQANDVDLYQEIHGDGPPPVLIMGLGGNRGGMIVSEQSPTS